MCPLPCPAAPAKCTKPKVTAPDAPRSCGPGEPIRSTTAAGTAENEPGAWHLKKRRLLCPRRKFARADPKGAAIPAAADVAALPHYCCCLTAGPCHQPTSSEPTIRAPPPRVLALRTAPPPPSSLPRPPPPRLNVACWGKPTIVVRHEATLGGSPSAAHARHQRRFRGSATLGPAALRGIVLATTRRGGT